jgi:predicted transcriptional regulator
MRRKIPTTFTVELDQLERLLQISARTRINRSLIVRDALERELRRYEDEGQAIKAAEVAQNGAP